MKQCPRCKNSEVRHTDRFCGICGLEINTKVRRNIHGYTSVDKHE